MMKHLNIVTFLFVACVMGTCVVFETWAQSAQSKPNIVFILVDQWRAQATGYSGDKNVISPNIDQLASQSVNLRNAVSGMPVCTPFRGSLMTGQYPLTHGLFMNDVMLNTSKITIAEVLGDEGYNTAFIGKWHMDGHGRQTFIPEDRRHGFDYWKALECTHDYNRSYYYAGNSDKKLQWEGYDAIAQSEDAAKYIGEHAAKADPFALFLSLGPPHNPYQTAPEKYRKMYETRDIEINPNVPAELHQKVTEDLRGYYAHITAIDDCIGKIWQSIQATGEGDNTIIIFTADHGDLLGAHGWWNKQQPYAESVNVPFLIHYPAIFGNAGKTSDVLINSPDIMPTLLGLIDIKIPSSVEGIDFSGVLQGIERDKTEYTLISCVQPFGQWNRAKGGKEYRGIVTKRYTYVKDLQGPWLLFDNANDPFQLENLIGNSEISRIARALDKQLQKALNDRKDEFRPGMEYVKEWNYFVDETGTVPYKEVNYQGKPIID